MRPEVQVLPGPLRSCADPGATRSLRVEEVVVMKPLVFFVVMVAAVVAIDAKRRQAQSDAAALWREATSDAAH